MQSGSLLDDKVITQDEKISKIKTAVPKPPAFFLFTFISIFNVQGVIISSENNFPFH